ncbi:hypothetical protein Tco_0373370 [Tanacetum coccineum]
MDNLYPKHGLCEIDRAAGEKLPNKNADESWEIIENLALYDHEGPSPQPQALNTTFEARVRDYMAAHTERMGRFKNVILKQREEINGRMTEMFRLLKELTTSRTPEKDERERNGTKSTSDCTKEPTKTKTEMPVVETKEVNKVESKANASKTSKNEEAVEAPGSQPELELEKKGKEYKILPGGPAYEAILKKRIAKKEDVGGNFKIPCSLGTLKFLDIREDENRPFILGTPFLTTAKASIKFDTGTITLRSGKHKDKNFKANTPYPSAAKENLMMKEKSRKNM